jgi:hypothetical protein
VELISEKSVIESIRDHRRTVILGIFILVFYGNTVYRCLLDYFGIPRGLSRTPEIGLPEVILASSLEIALAIIVTSSVIRLWKLRTEKRAAAQGNDRADEHAGIEDTGHEDRKKRIREYKKSVVVRIVVLVASVIVFARPFLDCLGFLRGLGYVPIVRLQTVAFVLFYDLLILIYLVYAGIQIRRLRREIRDAGQDDSQTCEDATPAKEGDA